MTLVIFLSGLFALALGYRFYGRFVEKRLDVSPERPTPAHTMSDNLDYVAAKPLVLFGHHFSSIAGAGPIVGPVMAAAAFGWLPAVIWIVLGSIFIGGVHDLSALVASIRHRARSIAEVALEEISPGGRTLFLIFVWFALVYVIVVFLDLTAGTFKEDPGVASSSVMYIGLALLFGLTVNRGVQTLKGGSLIFVPLVFVGIWLGQKLPLNLPVAQPAQVWNFILLGYCLIASVLPVWLLLQPRDYLSSYLLFACLAGGLVGVVFSGGSLPAESTGLPALVHLRDPALGFLFPALFVTIACGACSGFHSIVASGTTAKQLSNEKYAKPIAYGGMLLEGVLALISLLAVIIVGAKAAQGTKPTMVFGQGMGYLLSCVGLPRQLGTHFGALAISTFLLTTLDTCTRLARYVLEELLGLPRGKIGSVLFATILTLALPLLLTQVTLHLPNGKPAPAWRVVWPVFGATNQLLGSLALLVAAAWLRNLGRRHAFVVLPMIFMFSVTLLALAQLVVHNWGTNSIVSGISGGLLILAVLLIAEALRKVFLLPPGRAAAAAVQNPHAADHR